MAPAIRLRLAASLIGVLSVAAAFQAASIAKTLARQSPDPYGIEGALARFAPVCERVPRGAVLGYLTDLPEERAIPAFLQAQYALAPRLLISLPAADPPKFAVGVFLEREKLAATAASHGYLLEEDLGYGLVLLRRKGAR